MYTICLCVPQFSLFKYNFWLFDACLQVVNYGMGGQYEPHVDYYEVSSLKARTVAQESQTTLATETIPATNCLYLHMYDCILHVHLINDQNKYTCMCHILHMCMNMYVFLGPCDAE